MSEEKMTLEGGIFLVTNIRLVGGKELAAHAVSAEEHAAAMVAAAPEDARITANVTVTVIDDPEEYERAKKCREAAHKRISEVASVQTPIGVMAPHSEQENLDQAILDSREMIAAYNKTAKRTFVVPWIVQMALRADASTLKQVTEEMKSLLAAMEDGIAKRDPDLIRESAIKAKMYAEMMDKKHGEIVFAAIEEARKHAREVKKACKEAAEKGVEAAGITLIADSAARRSALRAARSRFAALDVDSGEGSTVEPIPVQAARALDVGGEGKEEESPDPVIGPGDSQLNEKSSVEELSGVEDADDFGDPDASRAVDADVADDAKAAGSES